MHEYDIDYKGLMSQISDADMEGKIAFLAEELPHDFHEKYLLMTPRKTNLCRYYFKGFEYIYDHYTELEAKGIVPYSPTIESRVVGVLGRSHPTKESRDASRLQGWVGQTEKYLGANTDKGHFMAHTIGGGLEVNIFAQRRDINRGWSERGKVYRSMVKHCAKHAGTFCFNRPIYSEDNSRPCMFEFGVLMEDGELWVEKFDNQIVATSYIETTSINLLNNNTHSATKPYSPNLSDLSGRRITVNKSRPKEEYIAWLKERGLNIERLENAKDSLYSDFDHPHRIYIGNLPYEIRDTELLKLFIKFGEVQAASISVDKMSQRSKGFGFILMSNESEVEHAVEALHNREVLNNGELIEDSNSTDENIPPHQKSVMNVIETASKELAKLICYEPGKLQDLEWRDLERMLALVFDGIGYAVQLTRSAKDGGKDLIVEFIATSQKHSYYIEVKHWVSGQKVGNKIVQEFLSVVVRDQKQGGILISTSGFSGSAMEGITEIERRKLRLGNSDTVVSLCRTYLNVSNGLLKPMNYTDMLMSVTRDGID